MDWKDILSQKVESGELQREDSTDCFSEDKPQRSPDTLHVVIDRKGRKGKTATIIEGFTCDDDELTAIASRLKTRLGVGGSARGGEILIQGDVADKVRQLLKSEGYKAK